MVLPAAALLAVFHYIPVAANIIAFQDYSPYTGILHSAFVGVSNFAGVVNDPDFLGAVVNTLIFSAAQILFFFPVPILLALLVNSLASPRLKATLQTLIYLPHLFSWVIVIAVFQQILGGAGLLSHLTRELGWGGISIMTDPTTFVGVVTAQVAWKDSGWGMVIFLAALTAADSTQYEAAAVDGAGRWRRLWHVTLPLLRPVVILLLILRIGSSLTVGFEQLILQRDAVGATASEVIDTYVYYNGVLAGDWSYSAAAGLLKGVISVLLVVAANRLAHAFGEAGIYQKAPR